MSGRDGSVEEHADDLEGDDRGDAAAAVDHQEERDGRDELRDDDNDNNTDNNDNDDN